MTSATTEYIKTRFTGDYGEHLIESVNDETRQKLSEFADTHNEVWLGKINLYDGDTGDLWQYNDVENEPKLYNFGANFAIDHNDLELVQMIKDRKNRPYTGTKEDYPLVTAIIDKITELKGILLIWA